jgi:hypothetical protein
MVLMLARIRFLRLGTIFTPDNGLPATTAGDLHYRKFVLIFKYFDRGCANSGIFAVLCRLGKMAEVERKVAFDLDVAAF